MERRRKSTYWLVFIGIALLIHILLFFSIKPGFFTPFKKRISTTSDGAPSFPSMPDAIITIPIEIAEMSDATVRPPEEDPTDEPPDDPDKNSTKPEPSRGGEASKPVDIESILGQTPATLPSSPGYAAVTIPPRPIQITWPETRNLKHCLGHHIDVRILVGGDGEILEVEAQDKDHPSDCIEAALESARHIVFVPGTTDGAPSKMWTQVRIEFKRGR